MPRFATAVGCLLTLLVVLAPAPAWADGVTLNFVPGTTYETDALTGYTTHGSDMAGMRVTAYFTDGSSQVAFWAEAGISGPGAYGTGWSLLEDGDTFSSPWFLANTSGKGLTRFVLDGEFGDTVFDVENDDFGTAGSYLGLVFTVDPNLKTPIVVTYRDQIRLTGQPVVGDLYRQMEVVFSDPAGLASGQRLTFWQDTDSSALDGGITAVDTPAPPGLLLALIGAVPLLARRRRG